MSIVRRPLRVALVLGAFLLALVAWQGIASASLTVTGATLDGVTSTSTPPGGVLQAKVTTKVTSSGTWRGTKVRVDGTSSCVDTADHGTGTSSNQFGVTAPGTPGAYDAGFTAAGANNCTGTQSAEKVLTDAIRVTTPRPNPNLAPRCGINVMLVLDKSGSISSSGATEKVRNAARAFLTALSGTGSAVSIVDFSTSAARPVGYTTVTPESIKRVFEPYLVNGYKPNGWTNWEDAFLKVKQANTQGPLADLVVFVTDGDPTARNSPPGPPVTGLPDGDAEALRRAAVEADIVKSQGSHVFAMGVGAAVTKPASASRLTAISGFQRYPMPTADFAKADYTLVQDFGDLAEALQQIAGELCQGSVTVTKLVDEGDGAYRPDPGWTFTANVATDLGTYSWLIPAPPPPTGPRTQTTDREGVATFQWKPTNAQATSTVGLSEEQKPGYEFVNYICETSRPGTPGTTVRQGKNGDQIVVGALGPNHYAKCTVRNRIIPGTIEIEKAAAPAGPTAFDFTGSGALGAFSLVDDGTGTTSSRTVTGLAPGTYTVREDVPAKWELTGITCSDPTVVVAGPEVTINLTPGAAVVCTYRDTRLDPPVPPEPPVPPVTPPTNPLTPVAPIPPVVPAVVPLTQLRLAKTAPHVARIGATIRFSLTVTNTGKIPAEDVVVGDLPPAALTLSGLRTRAGVRVINGSAFWRLGTIAPGARRTVRGSVRIHAGTPGLKRNIAVAGATNAQIVADQADTRVLPARVAPAFTG